MSSAQKVGFFVQRKMCSSCIYRRSSPLDLAKLEADVADPRMPGHFIKHRQCHHSNAKTPACCAGFWARHKDSFAAGQIAQRLGMVVKVSVDVLKRKEKA